MSAHGPRAGAEPATLVTELRVVDIENAVGSRLMLVELGLAHSPLVDGRYQLLRLLGRGARGLVCLARDLHLRREIALKLYPAHGGSAFSREVAREAQALARLKHPNIVAVYDFGDSGLELDGAELGRPSLGKLVVPCFYMSMEYVAGQSLRRWLASQQRSAEQVLDVYRQAAEGLAHAHGAGVTHRDFKPDNVMVDSIGKALVVDFGLADQPRGSTVPETSTALVRWHPAEVVGTYEYMAPEARVGQAEPASDQYSFGLALHEGLLGQLPVRDQEGRAWIDTAHFPHDLSRLLTRALAPDLRQRYPSMRALLSELPRSWQTQAPPPSQLQLAVPQLPPPSTLGRAPDSAPSRWPLFVLGLVLCIGALGFWAGSRFVAASGESTLAAGGRAEADASCPGAAFIGQWDLRALDVWDFSLSRRGVRGHYLLDVRLRDEAACVFDAQLTKVGSSLRSFKTYPVGSGILELEGETRAKGDWRLSDGKNEQHLRFSLALDEEVLHGHYFRFTRSGDGIERRSMIGPAYAARRGQVLPRVEGLEDIPCRDQCALMCGGEAATRACEDGCKDDTQRIRDCGPPSEDFLDPFTTQRNLERFRDREWKPATGGRACTEVPELLRGSWTLHERLDAGSTRTWELQLDSERCRLIGQARSGRERRDLIGEIDKQGRWVLRDARNSEELIWSMQGWSFAFGSAGGRRPGRLSGYKHRF